MLDERDKILRNLSGSLTRTSGFSGGNKADKLLADMGASGLNITPPSGPNTSSSPLVESMKASQEEMPRYKELVLTDYIEDNDGNNMTREDLEAKYELSEESKAIFNANLDTKQLRDRGLVAIRNEAGEYVNINPDNRIEIKDIHGNVVASRVGFHDTRTFYTKENKSRLVDDQIRKLQASKGIPTDHTEAFIQRSKDVELMGHINVSRNNYRRNLKVDTLYSNELSSLADLKSGLGPYLAGTRNDSRSVSSISKEVLRVDTSNVYANTVKMSGGLLSEGQGPKDKDGNSFTYSSAKGMDLTISDGLLGTDTFKLQDRFFIGENVSQLDNRFDEEIVNASARSNTIITDADIAGFKNKLRYINNKDGKQFAGTNLSVGNVLAMWLSDPIGDDLTNRDNINRVNRLMSNLNLVNLGPDGRDYNTMTREEREKFDTLNMAYYSSVIKPSITGRLEAASAQFGDQTKNMLIRSWETRRKAGSLLKQFIRQRESIASNLNADNYGRSLLDQTNNIQIFGEKEVIGDSGNMVSVPVAPNFTVDKAIGYLATVDSHGSKAEEIRGWHEAGYITDEGMGWFFNVINYQHEHTKGLNNNIAELQQVLDIKPGGGVRSVRQAGTDPGDISAFGAALDNRMLAGKVVYNGKTFEGRTDLFDTTGILPETTANLIDKLSEIYDSPRADFEGRPDVESYIQGVILTKSPDEVLAAYPKRLANFSKEDIYAAMEDMRGWSKQDFRDQVFELNRLKTAPKITPTAITDIGRKNVQIRERTGFPGNIFTKGVEAQLYEAQTGKRYVDRPRDKYSGERLEPDMTYDFITQKEEGLKQGALFSNSGMLLVLPGHPDYNKARKQAKLDGKKIINIQQREYAISPEDIDDSDEGVSLGNPTGGITSGAIDGKQVFKSEGRDVSELSTTFKYKGKWINIPSIHDGKQYTDDQLRKMLDNNRIKPTSIHEDKDEAEKAAEERSNQTRVR